MRGLKHGGIPALPDEVAQPLASLVDELKNIGLFLVPVGELEDWLSSEKIDVSKHNKWAWANAAALIIQRKGAAYGDIWDFVRQIARFLDQQLAASNELNA